jgi:hypothetical protein
MHATAFLFHLQPFALHVFFPTYCVHPAAGVLAAGQNPASMVVLQMKELGGLM